MSYLIQHCATPLCPVSIRFAVGQSGIPTCKWCQAGTSYYAKENLYIGLPDVHYPWPWQTDAEIARRIRLPYWQEKFKQNTKTHSKFIVKE